MQKVKITKNSRENSFFLPFCLTFHYNNQQLARWHKQTKIENDLETLTFIMLCTLLLLIIGVVVCDEAIYSKFYPLLGN